MKNDTRTFACETCTLVKINRWLKPRGLEITPEKTTMMVFTRRRKRDRIRVNLQRKVIGKVEENKFLGITINYELKWNIHTEIIKNEAKQCNKLMKAVSSWRWGHTHPQFSTRRATGNLITTPLNVLLHIAAEPDLDSRAKFLIR